MDTVDLKLAQDCESVAVAAGEGVNWLKTAAGQSPTVAQQAPSLISELQKVRNQSRKLARAARRRMCVGVFGPSQAGKSYLVSILASRDGRPDNSTTSAPRCHTASHKFDRIGPSVERNSRSTCCTEATTSARNTDGAVAPASRACRSR